MCRALQNAQCVRNVLIDMVVFLGPVLTTTAEMKRISFFQFPLRLQTMSQLPIGAALQDEQSFFEFVLSSQNQQLALDLIKSGIQLLSDQMRTAVLENDFHQQRTLNAKSNFLNQVAADRNAIYQEHEFIDAVEWIYGVCARKSLQARQSKMIEENLSRYSETGFAKTSLEQECWKAKVLAAQPTWGIYRGKANTSIQCALASSRAPVLNLTLSMNEAFTRNQRNESWEFCLQLQAARKETAFLSSIAWAAHAFHVAVIIYGREAAYEILSFVNTYSSLPHFKRIQESCRDSRYKGRLRYPSIREELELEFLGRTAKEAA